MPVLIPEKTWGSPSGEPLRTHYNRNFSRPFDVHRYCDHPEVGKVIKNLFEALKHDLGVDPRRIKKNKYLRQLHYLVLDLYNAWRSPGDPYIGIPRNPTSYRPHTRLGKLHMSFWMVTRLLTALDKQGFIELLNGRNNRKQRKFSQNSRIRANQPLIDMIAPVLQNIQLTRELIAPVILRAAKRPGEEKGREIDIIGNEEALPLGVAVDHYNEFLLGHKVTIALPQHELARLVQADEVIDLSRNQFCRIFNGDFRHGGRYYKHWVQGVRRDHRQYTLINGEPVVELDYSAMHPHILYAKAGHPAPTHDLYTPPGFHERYRPILKIMQNAMLNASDEQAALRGTRKKILDDPKLLERFKPCMKDAWLKPAMEALKDYHKPIAHFFNTGAGLWLQWVDSVIASIVLERLMEKGILALPIHDSFMVQAKHEASLREAMEYAAKAVIGITIPVDKK